MTLDDWQNANRTMGLLLQTEDTIERTVKGESSMDEQGREEAVVVLTSQQLRYVRELNKAGVETSYDEFRKWWRATRQRQ
ncbi:MAG: hypothetical protein K0U78_16385 [Actinomycetia bacterium]|nr:hypothetical protein [Actinomycetes bacterium]